MTNSVFPFPGGKSYLAEWIINHFPEHKCYVEVFGGSASILLNKQESHTEIYNDIDNDIYTFFKVLREQETELIEWLNKTPYSRKQHEVWKEQFYNDNKPEDPVERAGQFFFLRYSQYASKYKTASGFASAFQRNKARRFRNATEQLEEFANRFHNVQIENQDCNDLMDTYDDEQTFFYCDPPYLGAGDDLYRHGEFGHLSFIDSLRELDGMWCVSYQEVPEPLQEYNIVSQRREQFMNKQHSNDDRTKTQVEHLIMNYSLDEVGRFTEQRQLTFNDI